MTTRDRKLTLGALGLFLTLVSQSVFATGITWVPSVIALSPAATTTNGLEKGTKGTIEALSCENVWYFILMPPLCYVRDLAEIQETAQQIRIGNTVSDADQYRLSELVGEFEAKSQEIQLSITREQIVSEIAGARLVKKDKP